MAYQRILRGAPATISVVFEDQYGEPRNVSGVTIDIKRVDGSLLLHETGHESNSETHEVSTELTPAQTADLDILSLVATDADGSVAISTIDIVGGYLFSIAEAKRVETSIKDNVSLETLRRVRDEVESEVESICGQAFVPRLDTVMITASELPRLRALVPNFGPVVATRSGNHAWKTDEPELSPSYVYDEYRNLVEEHYEVVFVHGMTHAPPELKRAAIARFRNRLNTGTPSVDPRATSLTNEFGTFPLATPGMRGSETGLPDVDVVYGRYRVTGGSVMSVPIS